MKVWFSATRMIGAPAKLTTEIYERELLRHILEMYTKRYFESKDHRITVVLRFKDLSDTMGRTKFTTTRDSLVKKGIIEIVETKLGRDPYHEVSIRTAKMVPLIIAKKKVITAADIIADDKIAMF